MVQKYSQKIQGILRSGGVGIMPTDTIYGVVGSALSKRAVARIYKLRRRNPQKPMIILIASRGDLRLFGIRSSLAMARLFRKFWPGRVSVVLQMANNRVQIAKFKYLHRGTKSLAFRLPAKRSLRNLLKKTGPLVAPSANWEGEPSAKTIREAKKYFKNKVDFYLDGGQLHSQPSTLVEIKRNRVKILRQGATKI